MKKRKKVCARVCVLEVGAHPGRELAQRSFHICKPGGDLITAGRQLWLSLHGTLLLLKHQKIRSFFLLLLLFLLLFLLQTQERQQQQLLYTAFIQPFPPPPLLSSAPLLNYPFKMKSGAVNPLTRLSFVLEQRQKSPPAGFSVSEKRRVLLLASARSSD